MENIPNPLNHTFSNQLWGSSFLDPWRDIPPHHKETERRTESLTSHKEVTKKTSYLETRISNQILESPNNNLYLNLAKRATLNSQRSFTPKPLFFLDLQTLYHFTSGNLSLSFCTTPKESYEFRLTSSKQRGASLIRKEEDKKSIENRIKKSYSPPPSAYIPMILKKKFFSHQINIRFPKRFQLRVDPYWKSHTFEWKGRDLAIKKTLINWSRVCLPFLYSFILMLLCVFICILLQTLGVFHCVTDIRLLMLNTEEKMRKSTREMRN